MDVTESSRALEMEDRDPVSIYDDPPLYTLRMSHKGITKEVSFSAITSQDAERQGCRAVSLLVETIQEKLRRLS